MFENVGGNRKGKRYGLELWIFPTPFPSYDFFEPKMDCANYVGFRHHSSFIIILVYIVIATPLAAAKPSWCHDFQANDPQGLQDAGLDVAECAQLICDTFAEMIFVHGRVHADPHAGNIYFKAPWRDWMCTTGIKRFHRNFLPHHFPHEVYNFGMCHSFFKPRGKVDGRCRQLRSTERFIRNWCFWTMASTTTSVKEITTCG